jgi:hypothetical protein
VLARVREQLEEAVGKAYVVATRGSRNYYEHLVSVGANPHYAFKGAVSWSTNWSPFADFYFGAVAPCLDKHGVVAQDRAFWVAWSNRLMKVVTGGVTATSLSPAVIDAFVTAVVDRFFDMLHALDIPGLPAIEACIKESVGFGTAEATVERRTGE